MAAINDLINQIKDEDLRNRIQAEVNKLSKQKKFGLVFEDHVPECTPLYDVPVQVGRTVAVKDQRITNLYVVTKISDGMATCADKKTKAEIQLPDESLVSVAEFGEAIYPYLKPIDSVCHAPDSDLWHTLIEADNYHALQLLEYLYAGKVDCIYIDPPYNTGARDWKYNNDYVDSSDAYRHSKWLSMMEKRLRLAKKLLNVECGILIVAIDDYEQVHLSLLLEEIFSDYDCSTVIVNHHPQGGAADNIARTHEYALFVTPKGKKLIHGAKAENIEEQWSLTRGGTDVRNLRMGRPNSFYAIYVDKKTLKVTGVGKHLDADEQYDLSEAPNGEFAIYPIGRDGKERVWRYERQSMLKHIEAGDIVCTPRHTLNVIKHRDVKYDQVFSVWTDSRYNAGTNGTAIIQSIFDSDRFSYPKSLYTVEDCIKYSIQDNSNALILDFFAGSGTTLHAVNLLNAEDGGHRRCIVVTNNEVSDAEAKSLTKQGYKPGDPEWEKLGIARYITWPRTVCSIEGHDVNGKPLKGAYLGSERKMAEGFSANAAFFKLGFLDKGAVALGRQFKELLPVFWMKAGCIGPCPTLDDEVTPDMLVLPENGFAVLTDETKYPHFLKEVNPKPEIRIVFIVTDSVGGFREMANQLHVENCYQLYRDYLDNFRINTGR